VLVRYADDMVACCHSRQQAEQVKVRLAAWLAPRGLTFNEEKTRIVHLSEGFDFLGFTLRQFHGSKLIIKPNKKAIKRIRKRLTDEMRNLRGSNVVAVIAKLNPIIRGWAAYYPWGGVQPGLLGSGLSRVADHIQVGQALPPQQVEEVDCAPLLRQVQ
jgi:RNA-directed DNA polymerase